MKERFLLVLVLAAFLLVVLVVPAFAQTPSPFVSTLPDYGSNISSNVNQFLSWGTVAGPIAFIVGISIGALGIAQLIKVFRH